MTRKSNYRFYKRKPYRSYKKGLSIGNQLVIVLILLYVILQVIKLIIQTVVTYYYVFIALALICLIICYIRYNRRSQLLQPEELLTKTADNEFGIESDNVEKGNKFEKYVADKFDDKHFSIVEWTTDMCRKHNRFVESDCNPDLVIRDRETHESFCVECKYRSRLVNGFFNWSYSEQMERYFSYADDRKTPFYIVLGLGGSPDSPREIFCVPLEEARNPQIHLNMLHKYYHNPRNNFLWKNGVLK